MSDALAPQFEDLMQSVATAIGRGIEPLQEILDRHSISVAYYQSLSRNPKFNAMVHLAKREWDAADNTTKRIEHKSLIVFEETLPEMHARLHDKSEPLMAKVQLMKVLKEVAGLGRQEKEQQTQETFKVTINLGNGNELNIEKPLPVKVIDHDEDEFANG